MTPTNKVATIQALEPNALIITVVVLFILSSIGIGIYAKRKAKTSEQFFGGTKSFGPVIVALGSASTVMSAFGFIGGPGLVYKLGFTSIWLTFSAGIAFIYSYWILGKRVRAMAEVAEIATLPDIARIRFQSETVRGLFAFGLLIATIPYLATQLKGGAKLVNELLGIPEHWAIIILCSTIMFYTMISGMAGSILTSAFQGLVKLIAVFGVIVGFFILTKGDAMRVIQSSPDYGPRFIDGIGCKPEFIITYFIIFFVGMLGQPTMISKMYSLKNPKDLKATGILSGVTYAVTSLVWMLVGYGAIYISITSNSTLVDPDKAAFLFLSKMHIVIQALVMAALLAAIMSTASFFMSLGTSAITRDIMEAIGYQIPKEKQIFWGRVLTIPVTLLAVAFGYMGGNMVGILGTIGWGFFASVTLPTLLLGLLWKRTSQEGIIFGIVAAIFMNILFVLLDLTGLYKTPFPAYLFSTAIGLCTTVAVSMFTDTAGGKNLPVEIRPIFKL